MQQSCNNFLNVVKLHLATNCRCASSDQRRIASVVRRCSDDKQMRMRGATLTDKLLALAIVQIVIR